MILNLNEQLLRDTKDAHICIFIANLASWLRTNIDREKFEHRNVRDGKCWSYSTIKDYQNYFDFWSVKNIRTIIKHCEHQGLIEIGNYNKHSYDKTSWYTLTDKALEYYPILRDKIRNRITEHPIDTDLPETANAIVGNGKPIPENTTHSSIINNTNSESVDSAVAASKNKSKPNIDLRQLIDIYGKWFPDNPQPHKKTITNELEKVLRILIRRWPEAHPDGLPFTPEQFERYMMLLSSDARNFSKSSYVTKSGITKKNGMVTFCRWDTFVNFLENKYS